MGMLAVPLPGTTPTCVLLLLLCLVGRSDSRARLQKPFSSLLCFPVIKPTGGSWAGGLSKADVRMAY